MTDKVTLPTIGRGSSLAIYTPAIGVPSETFIRRHIEDLAPAKTVVICDTVLLPPAGNWRVDYPIHCTSSRVNWGFRLLRRQLTGDRLIPVIDPLLRFIKKHNVEVVLGEYMDRSLPLFRLLRGTGVRFFVHAHGHDVARCLQQDEYRRGYVEYADAAGIIAMSQKGKDALVALGLPPERIQVVRYGVDVPDHVAPNSAEVGKVRCVAVGRMTNIKAPILLLESFRRAVAQNPHLDLDYVGGGELFAMAAHYVRAWHLEDKVTLHGVQPSSFVAEVMNRADIFLQHSATDPTNGDQEGLPVAILEAMAKGLPVVSTRHAGIPEEVVEQETGILVDEGDVDGMATAILRLAADSMLRNRMGAAGHRRALEQFTWQRNRDELRAVMGVA
jgi:colanic acid/amylovoran biosynthesis glycosyltransferase